MNKNTAYIIIIFLLIIQITLIPLVYVQDLIDSEGQRNAGILVSLIIILFGIILAIYYKVFVKEHAPYIEKEKNTE